jgi:hypothetical protein
MRLKRSGGGMAATAGSRLLGFVRSDIAAVKGAVMPTLLDEFCPQFTVHEVHRIVMRTAPNAVIEHVEALDFSESRIIKTLFRLRGLRLSSLDMRGLASIGLRKLASRPGDEILFGGIIGADFKPMPGTFQELLGKGPSGLATLGWSFRVCTLANGEIVVETETRVQCERLWVTVMFLPYWAVIRPFSGLIRREMLRLLRLRCENVPQVT